MIPSFGVLVHRGVKDSMMSLIRSPSISDSRMQTFQNIITSKAFIIMDHTTAVQKGLEHRICQRTKRKRKSVSDRHPIIVQHLQEAYPLLRASANVLTCCWTACLTVAYCRSEMLFPSLSFCLLTEPVLRAFLYHCHTVDGDGGFWSNVFWKSLYKNRKKMAIEPGMSASNLLIVWSDS